jgi:putative ABC transport system substrate-binding protein
MTTRPLSPLTMLLSRHTRRRKFIALLGGLAAAWPIAASAQQRERMRRIGVLMGVADDREGQARVTALKQGLQELGWTDGRNIQIETRFGGADAGRIRAHAAELVALAPDVIVSNTTPVIRALRQATSSIPIVMAGANEPVEQGFVSSLAHPGGNITGFSFIDFQMVGKWLEMLKEAAPGVARAALMFNPDTVPHYYVYLHSFEAEPRSIAVEVTAAPVRDTAEIERALAKLGREPGGGLIVAPDPFTIVHHQLLIRLAQQHRLPAIYASRTYVAQGALMSYGPDPYDMFQRAASYVDRILKGAKPADLPVQQPTKFELAINLTTAKALGLQIPDKLLALANEVIE